MLPGCSLPHFYQLQENDISLGAGLLQRLQHLLVLAHGPCSWPGRVVTLQTQLRCEQTLAKCDESLIMESQKSLLHHVQKYLYTLAQPLLSLAELLHTPRNAIVIQTIRLHVAT